MTSSSTTTIGTEKITLTIGSLTLLWKTRLGHILGEDGIGFVIDRGPDYFFYIANTDLPNLYHRQIEIELDVQTPVTVAARKKWFTSLSQVFGYSHQKLHRLVTRGTLWWIPMYGR